MARKTTKQPLDFSGQKNQNDDTIYPSDDFHTDTYTIDDEFFETDGIRPNMRSRRVMHKRPKPKKTNLEKSLILHTLQDFLKFVDRSDNNSDVFIEVDHTHRSFVLISNRNKDLDQYIAYTCQPNSKTQDLTELCKHAYRIPRDECFSILEALAKHITVFPETVDAIRAQNIYLPPSQVSSIVRLRDIFGETTDNSVTAATKFLAQYSVGTPINRGDYTNELGFSEFLAKSYSFLSLMENEPENAHFSAIVPLPVPFFKGGPIGLFSIEIHVQAESKSRVGIRLRSRSNLDLQEVGFNKIIRILEMRGNVILAEARKPSQV